MTKLDYNIGNISPANDALFAGAIGDVADFAIKTGEGVASLVAPQTKVVAENTLQLMRKPIQTTFNKANWGKLALTVPKISTDVLMKAMRLPFSSIDNALNYVVNDNLERVTGVAKAYTTGLVGNIISGKGESRFKLLRGVGIGVEGVGDLIGSVVKLPTGLLATGTGAVDKFLAKGTETTDAWVKGLQISEKSFLPNNTWTGVTNSGSYPAAANDSHYDATEKPLDKAA